jgi:very-short-patch-repair endonuclease
MRDYVVCVCRNCHGNFDLPRWDLNRGRGTYCSRKCFVSYGGSSLLEIKMEKALILSKLKFEREVKFKRFHVDFLLEKYKTAIECDGEYWHLIPKNIERDRRKDVLLQSLGYKVLRFTGNELDKLDENKLSKLLIQKIYS